ncbi:hypothetical protein M9H77_23237 [Catharanthus roseus]|uniref:Uncharacterized protein n=1 Tax=Catharanthus roseus TaxID=4058 RepID=A0ACC0AUW8_CATRO|nr:hypothetical protein M9H77_23237 [Catharanthus roseus]
MQVRMHIPFKALFSFFYLMEYLMIHLLFKKYELELRNINCNIIENEIQEKISEGFAKWFRNEAKFYELWIKAKEDAEASSSGMSRGHLYGAGLEVAQLIAKNSRAAAARLIRRVEDVVSRVFAAFDEHMRRLFKHSHFAYIPLPLMMPLVRVAMNSSTSPFIHAPGPTSPLPDPMDGAPPSCKDAI